MKKIFAFLTITILIITVIPTVSEGTNEEKLFDNTCTNNETEYYAIIAACSKYNDSRLNIPKFLPSFADWKLKIFYNELIEAKNWKKENVILLLNEQATIKNITNAFDEMTNKVDEDDVFLFSWQGHGSKVQDTANDTNIGLDENDKFDETIDPYNCYRNKNGVLHNYITDDELNEMFSKISADGQFIIFDCCYSGGIIEDLKNKKRVLVALTEEDNVGLADLFIGFPMTESLSIGLKDNLFEKQKDKNKNGFLSAEEIFNWSKPIVKTATRSWLIECFMINLLIARKTNTGGMKVFTSAFFSTVLGYITSQMVIYIRTGDFAKNSPHMVDRYEGELDLTEL
ncbi:MAG: hypothetical protein V5A64_04710 [Candidatus Thermoplasmatota archaeon]